MRCDKMRVWEILLTVSVAEDHLYLVRFALATIAFAGSAKDILVEIQVQLLQLLGRETPFW